MFFTFLYIVLFIFFTIVTYIKFKRILTINMIFSLIWCFAGVANNNMLFGLFPLTLRTNLYMIVSVVIFNCIYIIFSERHQFNYKLEELQTIFNYNKEITLLLFLNICSYIFLFPIFLNALNIIVNQSWAKLRDFAFMDSEVLASTLQLRVSIWIIYPIFLITIIIAIIYNILQKKNLKLTIFAIIDVSLYSISFGGRGFIVKTLILFGIALILFHQLRNINIRIKIVHIFIGMIIFYILYLAISARSLANLSVIENLVVYLVGSFSYFDIITNSPIYADLNSVNLYGSGILGFILNPIIYVFSLLPGIENLTSEYLSKLVTSNFEYISNTYRYNALPTSMYPFWRDFGTIGIIIGTIIFALLVLYVEKKFYINFNMRWLIIYLIFIYAVFGSAMQYDLLTIQFSFIIFFSFLLTSKKVPKIILRK